MAPRCHVSFLDAKACGLGRRLRLAAPAVSLVVWLRRPSRKAISQDGTYGGSMRVVSHLEGTRMSGRVTLCPVTLSLALSFTDLLRSVPKAHYCSTLFNSPAPEKYRIRRCRGWLHWTDFSIIVFAFLPWPDMAANPPAVGSPPPHMHLERPMQLPQSWCSGVHRQQHSAYERFARLPKNEASSYREVVPFKFYSRMAGDPLRSRITQ